MLYVLIVCPQQLILSQLFSVSDPWCPPQLYMYQLFRSLAYIHSLGVCHRDIKPQNLLLDPETGVLKLCDFGSAKHLVRGEPNVSYICSRYYRAPELIFGATDYTTNIGEWRGASVPGHAPLRRVEVTCDLSHFCSLPSCTQAVFFGRSSMQRAFTFINFVFSLKFSTKMKGKSIVFYLSAQRIPSPRCGQPGTLESSLGCQHPYESLLS